MVRRIIITALALEVTRKCSGSDEICQPKSENQRR